MTKQEFLEKLQLALSGKVSPGQVAENIRFYEGYIDTEIRGGRSEEEVLSGLGDPRLIARTIVETSGGKSGQSAEYEGSSRSGGQYDEERSGGYPEYEQKGNIRKSSFSKVPVWVWLVLAIIVVVVVLSAIFSVIAAILPVVLPILLVLLLVKLFRDWIN